MSDLAHHGFPFQGSLQKKSMKMSELVELCLGGKTVFNSVISIMEFKAKHCFKVMYP